MRGISTLNLLLKGSVFAAALTAGSFNAFGQRQENKTCTMTTGTLCDVGVNYNFDNLAVGETAGFTGDFEYLGPESNNATASTGLQTTLPYETPKRLITPGFTIPSGATELEYTFTLGGPGIVSSFEVYIIYGPLDTVKLCSDSFIPQYQGSSTAKLCISTPLTPVTVPQSAKLMFVFTVDATVGNSTNKRVTFDDFGIRTNIGAIILPVNFIGFSARTAAKGAQLTWKVADEVNVSRYEVQKGSDAGNLKTIGIVFAGEKSTYTFTDEQPTQGVTFYRIRSVDADGKYKFSTVISFSNGKTVSLLRAFPMPARNQVTLQHGAIEGKAQITISSESGQIMKRVVPAVGSMQTAIDLSALKAGMYLLRLENNNGEVETLKVVKQ